MNVALSRSTAHTGLSGTTRQSETSPQESPGRSWLFYLALVLMPAIPSPAVPLEITQAEFTTYLQISVSPDALPGSLPTNYSRFLFASSPTSDYVEGVHYGVPPDNPYYDQFRVISEATSDWSNVSVYTREGSKLGSALAYAISDISFSPLSDEAANVTIEVAGHGRYETYSEGFVSLVDLTLVQPLWYYQWTGLGGDLRRGGQERPEPYLSYNIAGSIDVSVFNNPAVVTQETAFTAGHSYRLVMYAASDANGDDGGVLMRVSIIPEPGSFTLLALGSLALVVMLRGGVVVERKTL